MDFVVVVWKNTNLNDMTQPFGIEIDDAHCIHGSGRPSLLSFTDTKPSMTDIDTRHEKQRSKQTQVESIATMTTIDGCRERSRSPPNQQIYIRFTQCNAIIDEKLLAIVARTFVSDFPFHTVFFILFIFGQWLFIDSIIHAGKLNLIKTFFFRCSSVSLDVCLCCACAGRLAEKIDVYIYWLAWPPAFGSWYNCSNGCGKRAKQIN